MIENLLNAIQEKLGGIADIGSFFLYTLPRGDILAPAVCLEVADYIPGDDPATGELSLVVNMELRIVMDSTIPLAGTICQTLATNIANLIHLNCFGLPISPARLKRISRDDFRPDFDAYICWLIEWSHEYHMGSNVWEESGSTPHMLHVNEERIYE